MPINNNGNINNDYTAPSQNVNQKPNDDVITNRQPNDYLGKDAFLQLMITQLQYQDPLEPMDNQESIAQMAQFSALEQMQNLNTNMQISQAGIKVAIDELSENIAAIKKAIDAYGGKVEKPEEGSGDKNNPENVDGTNNGEGTGNDGTGESSDAGTSTD